MSRFGEHIGILGGSFNPVHVGHIMLADYIAQFTDIDRVLLMLSPLNPIKENPGQLVADSHRLEMLRLATEGNPRLEPCGIELSMPRPSYSIDSLDRLQKLNPDKRISLIIGSDNWLLFNRWREHEAILKRYSPVIYPRPGYDTVPSSLPDGVRLVNAPVVDLSSTFIRNAIAAGKDMTEFLPRGVAEYIRNNNLYL